MKRAVCLAATIVLAISALGYAGYKIALGRMEAARVERQREKAAADRRAQEQQRAEKEKQRAAQEELGRTFGACQAACPKETVALQIQELGQKVWFKCFCVLPDSIVERNVAYPKPQAEKAPSE